MKYISMIYYINTHSSDEPELCATPLCDFVEYAKDTYQNFALYDNHPMFLDGDIMIEYYIKCFNIYSGSHVPEDFLDNELVLSNAVSVTDSGEVISLMRMINKDY